MRGLDLRAIDRLGVRRLATDSRQARRGDIVLIAGKGHETYQETKGVKRPFSDLEAARAELRRWAA
jgi:UDP-N-acetylmuramyl tripeptide synthase